ncbi:electron transport complex subunit RsxC [Tatumella sp. JGM130]|uniref:electron transport complex subunit RsxC n=1 Tax=Tatumella sp. JGM130 TaxID=2799797 RepID=UPI001BB061D8|nr:electron transport complex subunit RsxC [Tatumella sp. JGM130]MBS0892677.1 electron transport complex subunit RsxC [Tatumella sp. JGM130]
MLNLFSRFRTDKIWDFKGGIHPPEMKTQSNGTPLAGLPLPEQFIIPLKQHLGQEGELLVQPGDHVLRGQALTFGHGRMLPVHAPSSGTVTAIAPHITAHPSGLSEPCIFIQPDGEDRWIERRTVTDYQQYDRREIIRIIHDAGVAGLGGAGFPTATKLNGGLQGVNTLIINAAECEPYITADDRLMQDYAQEVLTGCRILRWLLQADQVLIGIEDNKPEAIRSLKKALAGDNDLIIRVIPTKYPSGGAKQLTRILTGREVPHGGRSADIGVLMQNVGTAFAVKRAVIDGEPLTERVVTLTGEALAQPRNVWGRIGTPVSHLLQQAGFTASPQPMVIMGGPLMGFTLPSLHVPMVKITNCLLAPSIAEMGNNDSEQSCIRCSACADACPAGLLPQQLYWYCQGGDHEKARAYNLNDCIECGACAYVCPSNIPLVQYYRQEKAELLQIDLEARRTAEAKARFEARQQRLEREKQAREAKHAEAKRRVSASEQSEISAAIARVKARSAAAGEEVRVQAGTVPDNAAAIAQRETRKAEARARKQAQTAPAAAAAPEVAADNAVAEDPRKAAVAAAIARAKARKEAQTAPAAAAAPEAAADNAVAEDPRKAAVAAAIARAKARKEAQTAPAAAAAPETAADNAVAEDPRKAAVAAAIARAKAKKSAQATAMEQQTSATPVLQNRTSEE